VGFGLRSLARNGTRRSRRGAKVGQKAESGHTKNGSTTKSMTVMNQITRKIKRKSTRNTNTETMLIDNFYNKRNIL